jgi:hypothetical protein
VIYWVQISFTDRLKSAAEVCTFKINTGHPSIDTKLGSLSPRKSQEELIQSKHLFVMISDKIRALIISQIRADCKVSKLIRVLSDFYKKTTFYQVAKGFAAGIVEKQPWRKIDPKKLKIGHHCLTINKAQYSIRLIVRDFGIEEKSTRNILRKDGISCYKKKRNFIPMTQKAKRRFCCMTSRKAFRKKDLADFLFVDQCYFTVQKRFKHQNERCYGQEFEYISDLKRFEQFPKTPLSAIIFAGVSCEGRTPLVVLKSGFRLNQFTYMEQCISFVRKNLSYKLKAETAIFYQDEAPCHFNQLNF